MARALLLQRPSPFVYPGGKAGIDFNNPALLNCQLRWSGVATQEGNATGQGVSCGFSQLFPSLLRGTTNSAVSNTVNSKIDGLLGPVNSTTISTQGQIQFAGNSTVADASVVMAGIFRTGASVSSLQFIGCQGGNSITLQISAAGAIQAGINFGTLVSSGITATVNTPYFFAASIKTGAWAMVIRNLATGQVYTHTAATAITMPTPGGTVQLLNAAGGTNCFGGSLATFMWSNGWAGIAELQQWAQDPWSFWYPRTLDLSMMLNAPSAAPVTAFGGFEPFDSPAKPVNFSRDWVAFSGNITVNAPQYTQPFSPFDPAKMPPFYAVRDFQYFINAPGNPNQVFGSGHDWWPQAPKPPYRAVDWVTQFGNISVDTLPIDPIRFSNFDPAPRPHNYSRDWIEYNEIGYTITTLSQTGIAYFTPLWPKPPKPPNFARDWIEYNEIGYQTTTLSQTGIGFFTPFDRAFAPHNLSIANRDFQQFSIAPAGYVPYDIWPQWGPLLST